MAFLVFVVIPLMLSIGDAEFAQEFLATYQVSWLMTWDEMLLHGWVF